jgi:hypothetical protein
VQKIFTAKGKEEGNEKGEKKKRGSSIEDVIEKKKHKKTSLHIIFIFVLFKRPSLYRIKFFRTVWKGEASKGRVVPVLN